MSQNVSKFPKMSPNVQKYLQMSQNDPKFLQISQNVQKMPSNVPECTFAPIKTRLRPAEEIYEEYELICSKEFIAFLRKPGRLYHERLTSSQKIYAYLEDQ